MENIDWQQQCVILQMELDNARSECEEWKEKFERITIWGEVPRVPVSRGSPNTYTTVSWDNKEDWK